MLKKQKKLEDKLQNARKAREYFTKVIDSAKKLSGYREPKKIEEPVFAGRLQKDGYVVEKYFVKGEGDYIIPYLLMKPEKSSNKALLYLHPSGKSADAAKGGEMEWFVKNGITVLAPDIIGTGEMGPGIYQGDAYIDSVSYNLWFSSISIGRSLIGIRAGDVAMLTRLLKQNSNIDEVYGLAKREMSPVLLHAAAFDPNISRIALVNPYSSWQSLVTNRMYTPEFIHSAVAGALGVYDLPDLAASLAPRKLLMINVTSADVTNTSDTDISKSAAIIREAFESRNAGKKLNIVPGGSDEKLYENYKNWIHN